MFSHATVGCVDLARAKTFYLAALAPLGVVLKLEKPELMCFGPPDAWRPLFFVLKPENGQPMSVGNGTMIAFLAKDRASVVAFHAAALAAGGGDEGAPGLRPHYHQNYFGAYVRDRDGNKLCAVCHSRE